MWKEVSIAKIHSRSLLGDLSWLKICRGNAVKIKLPRHRESIPLDYIHIGCKSKWTEHWMRFYCPFPSILLHCMQNYYDRACFDLLCPQIKFAFASRGVDWNEVKEKKNKRKRKVNRWREQMVAHHLCFVREIEF